MRLFPYSDQYWWTPVQDVSHNVSSLSQEQMRLFRVSLHNGSNWLTELAQRCLKFTCIFIQARHCLYSCVTLSNIYCAQTSTWVVGKFGMVSNGSKCRQSWITVGYVYTGQWIAIRFGKYGWHVSDYSEQEAHRMSIWRHLYQKTSLYNSAASSLKTPLPILSPFAFRAENHILKSLTLKPPLASVQHIHSVRIKS